MYISECTMDSYLKHRIKTITTVIIISDTNTPPTNPPAIGRISKRRHFQYSFQQPQKFQFTITFIF